MTDRDILIPEDLDRLEQSLQHLSLPASLQRLIESYIEKKTGKHWYDPVVLERIRAAIIAQKNAYWKEGPKRGVRYRTGYDVLAYLSYQMPVFFAQFQHLLLFLARDGLLKERMTVFDVGSGPGVVSLALIDFIRRRGHGIVTIYSLDVADEHREAYQFLVPAFAQVISDVQIELPVKADLANILPERLPTAVDLIVFSNVLNEIPNTTIIERAKILRRYASSLSGDGTMVLIEPADLANATALRQIANAASTGMDALTLYAPCTFLWGQRCTLDQCWSFVDFGRIRPPALMQALSQTTEGYRFHNTDVKTSFALFRKDDRTRCPHLVMQGNRALPLNRLSRHIGKVINVVGAVMSGDIGDQKYHVVLVCDGTSVKPVYAIIPRYHKGNIIRSITDARYGDILAFDEVLVRYNRSHDAFNLLITARSHIRPLSTI